MSDDLFVRNIKDVTSIDISQTVIKQMSAKYNHLKCKKQLINMLKYILNMVNRPSDGRLEVRFLGRVRHNNGERFAGRAVLL